MDLIQAKLLKYYIKKKWTFEAKYFWSFREVTSMALLEFLFLKR